MKTITVLIAAVCCATIAQASIVVSQSAEWLCDNSDTVGIYKVVKGSVGKTNNNDSRHRYTYTLQLTESLKGDPVKKCSAKFSVHVGTAQKTGDTVQESDELIVFFQAKKTYEPAIIHQINLSRPWHAGARFVAVDAKFNVISKRKQIMTLVRFRLKQPPSKSLQVEIPPDSGAWKALWGGSACFLLVPEDLKPKTDEEKKQPTKPSTATE
jgi:hypothetical protein